MPPRPPHHLVTIGEEHDIRRQRGQSLRSGNIELTESAVWAQDGIAVLPRTDVILGGRYTTNSEYAGFSSPQTTLLLKPGNFGDLFT